MVSAETSTSASTMPDAAQFVDLLCMCRKEDSVFPACLQAAALDTVDMFDNVTTEFSVREKLRLAACCGLTKCSEEQSIPSIIAKPESIVSVVEFLCHMPFVGPSTVEEGADAEVAASTRAALAEDSCAPQRSDDYADVLLAGPLPLLYLLSCQENTYHLEIIRAVPDYGNLLVKLRQLSQDTEGRAFRAVQGIAASVLEAVNTQGPQKPAPSACASAGGSTGRCPVTANMGKRSSCPVAAKQLKSALASAKMQQAASRCTQHVEQGVTCAFCKATADSLPSLKMSRC
eukprot:GFYU01036073.1.p1 GENE.GFYU01036073.1~~GFYU01036073.1.p1  ORF type:complete len:288 (+),score=53.48 GFYU01036073.1:70-933(+)